jgi:hypothetical protein
MVAPSGQIFTSPIQVGGSFPYNGGSTTSAVAANGGTVTLDGATPVTVANTNVTANSIILFTLKNVNSGTVGAAPAIQTITPGTGFTVEGTAGDLGIYNYLILG